MIFTPNPKARAEDYCVGFGLSDHELELIRQLPAHSRCFLIRHANHSVVARLDLGGQPDMLAVLSGREATVRRLDQLRASLGDAPADWYQALTGMPWLSKIPGLGRSVSNSSKNSSANQILVVVTPHVLRVRRDKNAKTETYFDGN